MSHTLREQMLAGQPLDCRVIDVHAHLGLCPNFHIPDCGAAAMIAHMDRVGINALCLSAHTALYSDFVAGNDETAAAVEQFPTRLLGAVVLNPHYPDELREAAVRELRRRDDETAERALADLALDPSERVRNAGTSTQGGGADKAPWES